ncbi:protein kinase [Streptomyces sp. NBC_01408]|uniref:protein kinase domain-containing protein n=1 Tax=Streptomyces sp. NBC_01408 TaxID=2903855 RepID=UPI002B1E336E|nr:protein kinase [Streptomyces sp. NBC_01408]
MEAGILLSGRYRLVKPLGRGGFGEVWRGEDQNLRRPVALKILRTDVSGDTAEKRFSREAEITARLRHPGLVVVHDVGQDLGRTFIVMELLEGVDLAHVLRWVPTGLPLAQVVDVACQTLDAVAAAHGQGVVHRDLKPANLFRQNDGRVKVCDFGIAYSSDSTKGLTPDGHVMGTFEYLAPEQCRAEQVDARSDLYSFGCVLYALLTGAPPFTGGPKYSLLLRHVQEAPRSLRFLRPDVPPDLDALVLALLAKDPGDRPATAGAVAKALRELDLEARTPTAGRRVPVAPPPPPAGAAGQEPPRGRGGTTLQAHGVGHLLRGRYALLEKLAPRGPGETWRAMDRDADRQVTVRVLDGTTSARLDRARFYRDARVGARVRHPGLAVVHETDWDGELAFTVGEFVEGSSLHGVLARSTGGLPLDEALGLSRQLADALGAAHQDSVVHLGLTSGNVLRQRDGQIKLSDFGVTCAAPGEIPGSGFFTAPEQWRGERPDERTDLYAFGCLLYALFTAHPPFKGPGLDELRRSHLTQEAPLLRSVRPAVPPALERLASGLLAKEPGRRPPVHEAKTVLTLLAREGSEHAPTGKAPECYAPVDARLGALYQATGSQWAAGYHTGVDFLTPSGTAVRAMAAGTVISAGWAGSFGFQVILRHPDGIHSQYAHLSAIAVRSGQNVDAAQRVGRSGSTGNTTGPHLHFEIRTGPGHGSDIDPLPYLRSQGVALG